MSVNVHLAIVVRGHRPDRVEAIRAAVWELIEQESLENDLAPLAESTDDRGPTLSTASDRNSPLIVSGAYRWAPEMERRLAEIVERANLGPCVAEFLCEYADDEPAYTGDEDEEDEDDG